ncbi:MAG: hypothetical protein GWN99_17965 [Gemmatimonadetes bacterium]|uniref:Uncharacterized protein n=1 Tax=Candidatus Kutchimonas denitrificans TaxID=3056748 RepID=A0AAE4ZB64_9BACT|nr:hypothetical protein [Gemmatimonadota bacterium]NIR75621.1 hypothetical protein [Candidatus Kutchimonas denitrificans]NIS02922.1 hypothetical protein [Gemmatimonadota bacterium]NIT68644.1 hypothetical protein [Gemmatimonadota bacterium]NIV25323.1 hypothetical protein [Gemmatimonadota bacterium]
MRRAMVVLTALVFAVPISVHAQDKEEKIASALSAAPASITEGATVMDWDMTVLREGSNDWTCLPDMPDSPGNDPMCLDEPWLELIHGFMNKTDIEVDRIGFGYMLAGGSPESNVDPFAEGPTPDNEWLAEPVPHVMMIVPDDAMLEGLPTTPEGGPWVMWRGTPYVHVMIPLPSHEM